jgi:alkylated DNA repair dioxygenase AlkB
MITDFFKYQTEEHKTIITDLYELHRSFIKRNSYKQIYEEVKDIIVKNSSRKSCVCLCKEYMDTFKIYDLPLIEWTNTISSIRNNILEKHEHTHTIDYGLVHYYNDEKSTINWHSDSEALESNIYSLSVGGVRRFCLRDKLTKEILTFDLYDGDLFIMKIGCQDKYEHCIKSVKLFNQPRINITFRQIEPPKWYFIYDRVNLLVYITENEDTNNCKVIITTKQKIVIGDIGETSDKITGIIVNPKNASLIKSNLQKAIRRKLYEVALQSALTLIFNGQAITLLRRLTIISFEDVYINKYYPIIVWYYIALTSGYELCENDVDFIYSYIILLCNINTVHNNMENTQNIYVLKNIYHNVYCVSLYMRILYGGFGSEIQIMNNIIHGLLNGTINVLQDEISIVKYDVSVLPLKYLNCAIDFHCFPKMLDNVVSKINTNYNLTNDDIRNYIWFYDSSVNVRVENINTNNLDENLWYKIIKPKCDLYRYSIMKLYDIPNTI